MTALTTRDALAKALHPDCGYEHGGYDGPCGHLADHLIASGAVIDADTLADESRRIRIQDAATVTRYAFIFGFLLGVLVTLVVTAVIS